ncbi:TatD family hydrolase [Clostridium ihumii]|uniref:TatD family hydrolase n=1 Tax=Clostridium ihumii TaxID=1470356 RepID=UPI000550EE06|nr:TatD family hydrolase [Clostridium ihumii]
MIFDSHAHYDDESFNEDREVILKNIQENGVIGVLNCGADLDGVKDSINLANKYDFIYAAIGIHPSDCEIVNKELMDEFKKYYNENNKIKAIGEIGLDYYWDENPSKEIQKEAFRMQMNLARELKLPVIIHDRDAHKDTLEIMKEFKDVTGVVHCFSGSVEFAKECVKMGYYIGIGGVLTFKNAKVIKEVVKEIEMDRILLETDCPYMAPTPYRGKRNQSDYINFVVEKIMEIKGISKEDVENITLQNTKKLFDI